MEKLVNKPEAPSLPPAIAGFMQMVGNDIAAIKNLRIQKTVMHDVHGLILNALFEDEKLESEKPVFCNLDNFANE